MIEKSESFCRETGRKFLLILSYGRRRTRESLTGHEPFDRTLRDWLRLKQLPVIDMRAELVRDFAQGKL